MVVKTLHRKLNVQQDEKPVVNASVSD